MPWVRGKHRNVNAGVPLESYPHLEAVARELNLSVHATVLMAIEDFLDEMMPSRKPDATMVRKTKIYLNSLNRSARRFAPERFPATSNRGIPSDKDEVLP